MSDIQRRGFLKTAVASLLVPLVMGKSKEPKRSVSSVDVVNDKDLTYIKTSLRDIKLEWVWECDQLDEITKQEILQANG